MLQIGVQTKGIIEGKVTEPGFAMIAEAGFDCVDFNLDVFLQNNEIYRGELNHFFDKDEAQLESFFIPYREAMDKYGLKASQMHAPYPVMVYGRTQQNRYMQEQVIPKSLMIAHMMNIPCVVIHPWKLQYRLDAETEQRENLSYFRSLIPLAEQYHVMICMENLYESVGGRIVEGVCADPEEAVREIEVLNKYAGKELFGFCLDTGHMNLTRRNAYEMISILGAHLKILHLHDNDAQGDLHQLPYTFCGKGFGDGVNWKDVLDGLGKVHYRGVLSFESYPCVNSFPESLSLEILKAICQTGRYFAQVLEQEDAEWEML